MIIDFSNRYINSLGRVTGVQAGPFVPPVTPSCSIGALQYPNKDIGALQTGSFGTTFWRIDIAATFSANPQTRNVNVTAALESEFVLVWGSVSFGVVAHIIASFDLTFTLFSWDLPIVAILTATPTVDHVVPVTAHMTANFNLYWILGLGSSPVCLGKGLDPTITPAGSTRSSFAY